MPFISSEKANPFCLANSSETEKFEVVCCKASKSKKYQLFLLNFTAIQGSAPDFSANSLSCDISSAGKCLYLAFVTFASMAKRLSGLLARTSGEGYFVLPEPATLTAVQLFAQNKWINSLSALIPLDFKDMI